MLNDGTHPFHGEEYLCVPLTRTERDVAVRITHDDWVRGGSPVPSFANPWSPMTRKPSALADRQGVVRTVLVDRIAAELARYAGVEN